MNEKIKELYEECSNSVYAKTDGYGNDHYRRVTNYEKFAELIIRECVNIVENCDGDVDYARYLMQKHFGIE